MKVHQLLGPCFVLGLCSPTLMAGAQVVRPTPNLPPPESEYVARIHQEYIAAGMTIDFNNIAHHRFANSSPPPQNVGDTTTDIFSSLVDGDVSVNGGAPTHVSAPAQVTVKVTKASGPNGSPIGTDNTQMTQLDITGLPGGAEIRIDPNTPSTGQTTISTDPGGFRISSFFDVFTDISLDGGATWTPATAPSQVVLQDAPEPSALAVPCMGMSLSGLWLWRRRRVRQ